MAKVTPITEHFQHFLAEMKDSFWGDLYGKTRQSWKQFFEADSVRMRDRMADNSSAYCSPPGQVWPAPSST